MTDSERLAFVSRPDTGLVHQLGPRGSLCGAPFVRYPGQHVDCDRCIHVGGPSMRARQKPRTDAEELEFISKLLAQGVPLEADSIRWLVEMARKAIGASTPHP